VESRDSAARIAFRQMATEWARLAFNEEFISPVGEQIDPPTSENSEATPVEILASSLLTPSSENTQPEVSLAPAVGAEEVSVEGCPVGDAPVGITVKSSPLAKTLKRAARITATVMRAKMRSQRGPFIRRRSPRQTQLHRALSRRPPFEHDCRRVSPHNLLDVHSKYWTPRSDRCRIKRQGNGKEVVTQTAKRSSLSRVRSPGRLSCRVEKSSRW
jgi:hypothetical protein